MYSLKVTPSPHVHGRDTTAGIMIDVVIALIPAVIAAVILFGWRALCVIAVSVAAAVLAEFIFNKIMKKSNTLTDFSAVVTGLLLALNMPPSIPLWIPALGSVIAIVIVKGIFGGLGQNFANPAITARIVLMVSFPTLMTAWTEAFAWKNVTDTVTSATPLAAPDSYSLTSLFLGARPGCIGETCSVLLIVGGLYLVARHVISPMIPVSFVGTVGLLTFLFSLNMGAPTAAYTACKAVMSGGLLLGAIFMATDYVTSPTYKWGKLIFGIGCGIITFVIRRFGSLPEGVSFSILLMNVLTPHINNLTVPKPFAWEADKNE